MPFISYYNFIVGENIIRIARSIKPLIYVITGHKIVDELAELRMSCVEKTVRAVDEIGYI